MNTMTPAMYFTLFVCLFGCVEVGADSNEGNEFAFALLPNPVSSDHAELILNARETTDVTITTSLSSETVTVYGNWSHFYDIDYSMRVITDIEDKGIYVTADEPITAHVATRSSTSFSSLMSDAVLLRPTADGRREYFLAGYDDMSTSRPMSYYMVVAIEDNTEVDVFYTNNGISVEDEHFTLQRFEVFTRDSYNMTGRPKIDFTGTRVVASKPIFVQSGNGHAFINAEGGSENRRHIAESMPALSDLGTEYTTFPLHFGGDGGYEVRIIAVADDTDVRVPAFHTCLTLHAGEFYVIDNTDTRLAFKVACSKSCMVVQYVRGLPAGGDTGLLMGAFLAILTPNEGSSNSLIFTVPSMIDFGGYIIGAISINVNTFPVTGLYLNDTSLVDLDWQPVEESEMWSATMDVDRGFYELYSADSTESFTAYVYLLRTDVGTAFGLPIGYADITKPTQLPPTPPPVEELPPNPQYRIGLYGNFTSITGEDFTAECTQGMREEFQAKAVLVVSGLNDMIEGVYCTFLDSDDIRILSAFTTLLTSGAAGVTYAAFLLDAASHVTISNFTSCAGELSIHLQNMDYWGWPVIPPRPGCPEAVFNPGYFYEGPDGNVWVCVDGILSSGVHLRKPRQAEVPMYSLSLYDFFTTADNEDLDALCILAYTQAWQDKATNMVPILNGEISAARLCNDSSDKLVVVASSTTFSPQGSQGSLTGTFFMRLTYDHLSFDDVHSCTAEMFIFLADHTNWGSLPLLPQEPGCPELLFEPPQFYHYGESWQCF